MLLVLALPLGACEPSADVTDPVPAPGEVHELASPGPDGPTGWWPSLATDASGTTHLAFCDAGRGDVMYARRAAAGWQLETVLAQGNVGKFTAIATHGDRIGISFYDQDRAMLRYAERRTDGPWQLEDVAWGKDIGQGSELRIADDGAVHLFYYLASGGLIHATRSGEGAWQKHQVTEAAGGFTVRISPVLRPEGFWLSYVDWRTREAALMLSAPGPKGRTNDVVADRLGAGWRSALFFDDASPLVFYSQNIRPRLKLATRRGSKWSRRTILGDVGNFAAARDAAGEYVIAYEGIRLSRAGSGQLFYLRGRGKTWRRFGVDATRGTGSYLALALDGDSRPVIAYFDARSRGLKVYDERPPRH